MNKGKIRDALQDLVTRLEDAEQGFQKIQEVVDSSDMKEWMRSYSSERATMQSELKNHLRSFGEIPEEKTSFLGKMHRAYINLKINIDSDMDSVINEIERGESTLLKDYEKVISDVDLPADISSTLKKHRTKIDSELNKFRQISQQYQDLDV